jgi:hypothetical protein
MREWHRRGHRLPEQNPQNAPEAKKTTFGHRHLRFVCDNTSQFKNDYEIVTFWVQLWI